MLEMRFSIPWAQKEHTMPFTVAWMLVAANKGKVANASAREISSLFMMKLSKNVHKVEAALGAVVHAQFEKKALVDQTQHWRDFRLVRQASHASHFYD
jgi:hypothetical protein